VSGDPASRSAGPRRPWQRSSSKLVKYAIKHRPRARVQAIARRGDGRVINVSPLWTLQCLSSGPDQMLRQPTLTAKSTMTRAGDVNDGLDRGAAIRERPLQGKGKHQECRDA